MENKRVYKIGEFAERVKMPVSTVNYYVNKGLIHPQKVTPAGYRLFSEESLNAVSTIRELQTQYLPLEEIRKYLEAKGKLRFKSSQTTLPFPEIEQHSITFQFPSTRYQGSKLKLVEWIWQSMKHLDFESALDAFGGTSFCC